MAEPAASVAQPYKDRYAGLVAFGILEILSGLFFAIGLVYHFLDWATGANLGSLSLAPPTAPSLRAALPGLLFHLLVAVSFIWLGIGSLHARRWARALLLITSWIWLLAGVTAALIVAVVFPDLLERALATTGSAGMAWAVFFHLLLPLPLVLFYRARNVKTTCEARDPKMRWTDRCPLPVLGLSLALGLSAAAGALAGVTYGALPFFGRIVTGAPAAGLAVALVVLLAVLARAIYERRSWAWWAVLAVVLVGNASCAVTLASSISWLDLYRAMGLPTTQAERLGVTRLLADPRLFWLYLAFLLAVLGFLLWVKRYFRQPFQNRQAPLPPRAA